MKKISLYIMAGFYIAAGINHFINLSIYRKIMSQWLGHHDELIFISGICEALFGLLLIPRSTRPIAAWSIISLLITVFPANIQMAINFLRENNSRLWIAILRLPFQFVLIWWAYLFTKTSVAGNKQ